MGSGESRPTRARLRNAVPWIVLAAVLTHVVSAGAGNARNQQQSKDSADSPDPAQCVVTQEGDTRVRSVVLSHARGQVGLDRRKGRGMELAVQNTPVVQEMKMVTADGYAEVELEDGTHIRLTPSTVVDFHQLALHRTGERASVIGVPLGTVYVNTAERKGSEIRLQVGATCISVSRATHLRLEISLERIELAVFTGGASVEAPPGHAIAVGKKQSLPFHVDKGGMATIVSGVEVRPYDAWEADAMREYEFRGFLRKTPMTAWR
jgi:FecR protein.